MRIRVLRYVFAAGVIAVAELVLKAIDTGAAMPDARTVVAAAVGASLRGALAILDDREAKGNAGA
ncbi:MAG: hypothetical protein HYX52_05650 [Chloroflexi bacterium]|nr:hypothetical protein [Chloroflexota bacterium]